MNTFKYGDLEITTERLEEIGNMTEYGIKIQAPGHPLYAFKAWYPSGDEKTIAINLVHDLTQAYENPLLFSQFYQPKSNREFIRTADLLRQFLHQAHLDSYRQWATASMPNNVAPLRKGPREWFPSRKKSAE